MDLGVQRELALAKSVVMSGNELDLVVVKGILRSLRAKTTSD